MSNKQVLTGVGVVVAAFNNENAADDALKALNEARKHGVIEFDDVAVIRQDSQGQLHCHETGDMGSGQGAGIGALIGGALGILAGPAGIAIGAGLGAAVGAAAAHVDAGFKDANLERVGTALKPDSSALLVIINYTFLKAMQANVSEKNTQMVIKQLATGISTQLAAGNDIAFALVISEEGVTVTGLPANDEMALVMGIATDEKEDENPP